MRKLLRRATAIAASSSAGNPDDRVTRAPPTLPSPFKSRSTSTVPCHPRRRARAGYTGTGHVRHHGRRSAPVTIAAAAPDPVEARRWPGDGPPPPPPAPASDGESTTPPSWTPRRPADGARAAAASPCATASRSGRTGTTGAVTVRRGAAADSCDRTSTDAAAGASAGGGGSGTTAWASTPAGPATRAGATEL